MTSTLPRRTRSRHGCGQTPRSRSVRRACRSNSTVRCCSQQTFAYNISQDLELGGKRRKRIASAEADAELARAQFEIAVWQMTNDVKRKFYTVLLDRRCSILHARIRKRLTRSSQHTRDVFQVRRDLGPRSRSGSRSRDSNSTPTSPTRSGITARPARSAARSRRRLSSDGDRGRRSRSNITRSTTSHTASCGTRPSRHGRT